MKTIANTLIQRGYDKEDAVRVALDLNSVNDCLKEALNKWLLDGTETDYKTVGYSILGLKNRFDMTYPAALLSMDWIIKEPEEAIACIEKGIR